MSFPRALHSKIFLLLIIWRISSVFIVDTFHVPDEYWQSLEVAHKLVFDYGYLTWEWHIGIRSYLYPFLISIFYSILKFLNLDYAYLLIILPRIFQSLLCAFAEYKFYLWTNSKFALFNICINWYWYYCASRTIINSFETCLTIIALSEYPLNKNTKKDSKFLWVVGFLCFARPTAAVFWFPLCLYHLCKNKFLFPQYILTGTVYFFLSTSIDVLCYGKFVLTPIEFFKVNVLNSISEEYGKYHVLWYFYSGLPVVLGVNCIFLPFAFINVFKNHKSMHLSTLLSLTSIWSICVYSLLAHKEFRFILPIVPVLIYVIHNNYSLNRVTEAKKKFMIFILVVSNVLPGIYFSVLYQSGPLEVMTYLRREIQPLENSKVSILFLTNCHGTPYYSHLHQNISMRFLSCEPNLKRIKNYKDEQYEFFENPMVWLEKNYMNETVASFPSHVVAFDSLLDQIKPFLQRYNQLTAVPDVRFIQAGNSKKFVIFRHQ